MSASEFEKVCRKYRFFQEKKNVGRWPSKEKLGSKVDNLKWIPGTHMTEGERFHFCKLSPASQPLNLYQR